MGERAAESPNRLTARQREIAELVAAGLTNREIAKRLFISERTADGHLEQIRNKLGVSSRAQIAAWLVQQSSGSTLAPAPPVQVVPRPRGWTVIALVAGVLVVVLGLSATALFLLAQRPAPAPLPGSITTYAGTGNSSVQPDGISASAADIVPAGLAFDQNGQLYFFDSERLRMIDRSGAISTIGGSTTAGYSGDGGAPTLAQFRPAIEPLALTGLVVDSQGTVYVSDAGNQRVRRVAPGTTVETVAGTGEPGYGGDGGPSHDAQLRFPRGLALAPSGDLYIADSGNNRIRKVDASGQITTVAGTGSPGFSGDGGPATEAQLNGPEGLTFDPLSGSLLIADTLNHRVRKVNADGRITTSAGSGRPSFEGDGTRATAASLRLPLAVSLDSRGNLYILDAGNLRVREVNTRGLIYTVVGDGSQEVSPPIGDGQPATRASLLAPVALTLDSHDNLYIADIASARIRRVEAIG
jgi:trimeric autotransporter adhesin